MVREPLASLRMAAVPVAWGLLAFIKNCFSASRSIMFGLMPKTELVAVWIFDYEFPITPRPIAGLGGWLNTEFNKLFVLLIYIINVYVDIDATSAFGRHGILGKLFLITHIYQGNLESSQFN